MLQMPQKKRLLVIALCLLSFAWLPPKKIHVYLIGDSTMAYKEPTTFPETGWGMTFATFFDESVMIDNRAKNGRSTSSFIAEDRWKPIANALEAGDYVFIQFGHNDESVEKKDRYSPPDKFKANLTLFINDARTKNAIPVLITPVGRRNFDSAGLIKETHMVYSALVKEVASATNTPCIDLDTKSRQLYQQMGAENSKHLFNWLQPGEHPNYPKGRQDNTHFNEYGARKIAEIVFASIIELQLELTTRIVKPKEAK